MVFLASDGFTASELGGDVMAIKGFEDLADVGVLHRVDVFEEGNETDEIFVCGVTFPGVEDDGVFGLFSDVASFGVDDDNFGEVTVEVAQILSTVSSGST